MSTGVEDDAALPWVKDTAMRDKLELAGWRYAILIGITDPDPDDALPQSLRDADAAKYPHLIHKDELERPIWHCEEAAIFVSEITGYSRAISDIWLKHDWPS